MPNERTILVVDDEDVITWAISQALTREGEVRVDTAPGGEEALAIMKRNPFDLVITDIRMKGMNGFELLSKIRTLYPETGVIVMTAYGSVEAKREATERGSLLYLDKTFEIDEIRQLVRKALEQVDRTRALREQQTEGFSGQIGDLNLVDMVQLHCLARNTVMMDVRTQSRHGAIGFIDGEIVYAHTDSGIEGRDAFIDMLGWSAGQFETITQTPNEQNVNESWESLLLEASDVISSAREAATPAEKAQPQEEAPSPGDTSANMHAVLEDLAIEQGVLGVFVAGDTGVLIDQVITTYPGNPDDIGVLAQGLKAVSNIRRVVEPESAQNRVILQYERTRIVAREISDTAVYLIVITSGTGGLARVLQQLTLAAERLATLF